MLIFTLHVDGVTNLMYKLLLNFVLIVVEIMICIE